MGVDFFLSFPLRKRLLIVTVTITKDYLILTVNIFKKYLIVKIVFFPGGGLIRYCVDIMKD